MKSQAFNSIQYQILIFNLLLFCFACTNKEIEPVDDPSPPITSGDAPAMQWHKGYGTDKGEHIHEVMETMDGGFLGIGQTEENSKSDLLVIKIDADGDFIWQRIIGTTQEFDVGICVEEVADGYLIGGGVFKINDQQRYLAKLDFNGNTIWENTYNYPGQDMIRGIALADNGDILLTGYKGLADAGFIFIADDSDGFVMRVNAKGEVVWEKPISAAQGAKIRKTTDGYAICTTHWMNDPDHPQDFYLIKLDEDGNEIWKKNYGGDSDEHCYDCDVTTDGGFILGGHTRSPSYGVINWDFLMMKIDAQGNEEWHRTFGQPRGYDANYIHDEAYGVRQTPDGGYVLLGGSGDEHSYSASGHPKGASDIWKAYLVKVDSEGTLEWQDVYGSNTANNAGEYLTLTRDGGFVIGTDSDSAGAGNFEPNNFGFLKVK